MRFKEILNLDKKLGKKDKVTLYRAYIMKDGEEMVLPTDGELFFLSREKAFENLVNRADVLMPLDDFLASGKITPMITFLNVILPISDNKEKELMPGNDECYNDETGSLQVALNGLVFDLDVEDMRVSNITYTIEDGTEIKRIKKLELEDFWKEAGEPKKKKK